MNATNPDQPSPAASDSHRRFVRACFDFWIDIATPIIVALCLWAWWVNWHGFWHGFTTALLAWRLWSQRPRSANDKVIDGSEPFVSPPGSAAEIPQKPNKTA